MENGIFIFWLLPALICYFLIRKISKHDEDWTYGRMIFAIILSAIPAFNFVFIFISLIVCLSILGSSGWFDKEPPKWL